MALSLSQAVSLPTTATTDINPTNPTLPPWLYQTTSTLPRYPPATDTWTTYLTRSSEFQSTFSDIPSSSPSEELYFPATDTDTAALPSYTEDLTITTTTSSSAEATCDAQCQEQYLEEQRENEERLRDYGRKVGTQYALAISLPIGIFFLLLLCCAGICCWHKEACCGRCGPRARAEKREKKRREAEERRARAREAVERGEGMGMEMGVGVGVGGLMGGRDVVTGTYAGAGEGVSGKDEGRMGMVNARERVDGVSVASGETLVEGRRV